MFRARTVIFWIYNQQFQECWNEASGNSAIRSSELLFEKPTKNFTVLLTGKPSKMRWLGLPVVRLLVHQMYLPCLSSTGSVSSFSSFYYFQLHLLNPPLHLHLLYDLELYIMDFHSSLNRMEAEETKKHGRSRQV